MMLIACSPSADNAPETHSSLRFAMRAKNVKNAAVVNRVLSVEQLTASNAALRLELAELRRQVAEGGCGGEALDLASAEEVARLRAQLNDAQGQLSESSQQLQAVQAELEEERQEKQSLNGSLKEREEESELLHETLARFQVMHGVAPVRCRDKKKTIEGVTQPACASCAPLASLHSCAVGIPPLFAASAILSHLRADHLVATSRHSYHRYR